MNPATELSRCIQSGEVSADFRRQLQGPSIRRDLYYRIAAEPLPEYRSLLLFLLDEEISFRRALWEGRARDEDDCFEGIYQCAFLLSRCGEPDDAKAIWKAQYLNQDIGEIYVGYFVGAGMLETLQFLEQNRDAESREIAEFIREALSLPGAVQQLEAWESSCRESLDNCR